MGASLLPNKGVIVGSYYDAGREQSCERMGHPPELRKVEADKQTKADLRTFGGLAADMLKPTYRS